VLEADDPRELYCRADDYLDALAGQGPVHGWRADEASRSPKTTSGSRSATACGTRSTAVRRSYDLKVADPCTGQVAWFGIVEEHGHPAIMGLRLALDGGRISPRSKRSCAGRWNSARSRASRPTSPASADAGRCAGGSAAPARRDDPRRQRLFRHPAT
jgi:hypothetical protein